MTIATTDFLVSKQDIQTVRFESGEIEPDDLKAGQVVVAVKTFAFSANNITYALLGESFKYWQFFPNSDEDWGKLPVWGYGEVVESRHEDVPVGERLFGYYPLATHLIIEPGRVTSRSIVDNAAHRRDLSAAYNQYTRISGDAAIESHPRLYALLWPLFITAFLLEDFLADNDFFGGEAVVLTSASSKTAYSTAFLLDAHRAEGRELEIVGLTSAGNITFVKELGCYDRVVAYDAVETLTADQPVTLIDVTGNGELVSRLHHHYDDQVKHSSLVGLSHQGSMSPVDSLPGARPSVFFAPSQFQKRLGEWGGKEYVMRQSKALNAYMDWVVDWVRIKEQSGTGAIEQVYDAFVRGDVSPQQGYILSF